MSGLSNVDLLQVNATIIVGLVLLFTFQSFSSILAPDYNDYFENLSGAYVEWFTLEGVIDDCMLMKTGVTLEDDVINVLTRNGELPYPEGFYETVILNFDKRCETVYSDWVSITQKIVGMLDYGYEKGYITEDIITSELGIAKIPRDVPTTSANVKVVLITIVMIMPFIISSILAIRHASNSSMKDESSKLSLKILLSGFFVMIFGFLYIGFLFFNISGSG